MTCRKCNGLLISERILDFYAHIDRWKCINCGASSSINSSSSVPHRVDRIASTAEENSPCRNRR